MPDEQARKDQLAIDPEREENRRVVYNKKKKKKSLQAMFYIFSGIGAL